MRLTTRAGKMQPSCPLGTTRCIPQEKFPRKPDFVSVHKYAKKELLTSHLVNNPYVLYFHQVTWGVLGNV